MEIKEAGDQDPLFNSSVFLTKQTGSKTKKQVCYEGLGGTLRR